MAFESDLVHSLFQNVSGFKKHITFITLAAFLFPFFKSLRGGVFFLASSRYSLAIQAMLKLPKEQEPLRAAMILREDALQMGVRLPVKVQLQLLDESLKARLFFFGPSLGDSSIVAIHLLGWFRLINRFELGWNSPARLWWNNRHASMVHSGSVPWQICFNCHKGFSKLSLV